MRPEGAEKSLSDEEKRYLYHRLSDKGVADCIESLIGAYLVSGGISAGLKFMAWMGIKIIAEEKSTEAAVSAMELEEEVRTSSLSSTGSSSSYAFAPRAKQIKLNDSKLPVFIQNSASILTDFFQVDSKVRQLDKKQEVELNRLLSISLGRGDAREILGWTFKDRILLLEAVTHASYTKNRLTNCYQRLEFLGDAVLDYLITCHIYSTFPGYGPGEISSMRSALVNNFTFAELAVNQNLHKALLYNSPLLYKQTEKYIKAVEQVECRELIVSDLSSLKRQEKMEGVREEGEIAEEEEEEEEELVEDLDPPKVLGDLLESIAGAIFIDSGMSLEAVWSIFRPLFDRKIGMKSLCLSL